MIARILQILILCLLVVDGRLLYIAPGPRLLALFVSGQSQCPLGRTMESVKSVQRIQDTEAQMNQKSHLLRAEGELQLWDTPRGQYWLAGHSPDLESNKYALVLAEQDQRIYGEGEHFVHHGDIVLDCGADYGGFTRSALWAGAAVVVAIEPAPYKEECLRRTFAKELQEGRVVVVPKGVWNKEDTLTLYGDSLVQQRTASGPVVPLTTIDKLATDLHLARVDFIKMDIEGAEKQALEGGRQTIKKFRPRLAIATEHLPDDAVKIPEVIRGLLPDYQIECGPCEYADQHIRPQVLRFY